MKKIHYGWWIMVACCAINCLSGIISSSAVNFFNPVAEELNVGIGEISLYMTIMLLTSSALLPMYGRIIEKYLRPILLFAGAVQCIAFALMGMLHHVQQFWIAGVFLGMGVAVTYSLATPVLINMWFRKNQGLATGIAFSFLGISGAVFSVVAGNMIVSLGWRMAYIALAACTAIIYIPAVVFLVHTPEKKGLLPYGAEDNYIVETEKVDELIKGVTLQQALRHPSFYLMIVCAVLLALAGSEASQIPAFSVGHFGMSIEDGAQVLAINSIGITIGTVLLGAICDRIGHAKTMLFAMGMAFAGHTMLLAGTTTVLVRPAVFIIGIGFSSVTVLLPLFGTHVFGNKEFSRIWSIVLSAASIASAVAISLYGFIFDITASYYVVFIMVAAICVLVAVFGMAAIKFRAKF